MRKGKAISFVNAPDELHLQRIEKLIRMNIRVAKIPKGLLVEETPFEEQQEIDRKIDSQRKKADPDFKGAFHEKKVKKPARKSEKRQTSSSTYSKSARPSGDKKIRKPSRKPGK
jgi:ATP-dependent RNA helicase RhlE